MVRCAIITCRRHSKDFNLNKGGISFHRFSGNPIIRQIWINATGRLEWIPTKSSTICSKHFLESDFCSTPHKRCLKPSAIPQIEIVYLHSAVKNEEGSAPTLSYTQDNSLNSPKVKNEEGSIPTSSYPQDNSLNSPKVINEEGSTPTSLCTQDNSLNSPKVKNEEGSIPISSYPQDNSLNSPKVKNEEGSTLTSSHTQDNALNSPKFKGSSPAGSDSDASTSIKLKFKEVIQTKEDVIKRQRKQIKRLQAQTRRLKKKVKKLEHDLSELKEK